MINKMACVIEGQQYNLNAVNTNIKVF